jgi:hypothetical protein
MFGNPQEWEAYMFRKSPPLPPRPPQWKPEGNRRRTYSKSPQNVVLEIQKSSFIFVSLSTRTSLVLVLVYISAVLLCRVPARNSSPSSLPLNLAHISCIITTIGFLQETQDLAHIPASPALVLLQESLAQKHCFWIVFIYLLCCCVVPETNSRPKTLLQDLAYLSSMLLYSSYKKLQLESIASGSCSSLSCAAVEFQQETPTQ